MTEKKARQRVSDVTGDLGEPLDRMFSVEALAGREFTIVEISEWQMEDQDHLKVIIHLGDLPAAFIGCREPLYTKLLMCRGHLPLQAKIVEKWCHETGFRYFDIV